MADAPKKDTPPITAGDLKPPGDGPAAPATPSARPAAQPEGGEHAIVKALQRAFPHATPEFAPPPSPEIREGGEFLVRGRRVDAEGREIKGDRATDHVVPATPPSA